MREIKFRAWYKGDTYNKPRMLINIQDACDMNSRETNDLGNFGLFLDKNDYVFMQYTGLKDKNGKEIYEGDLIQDIYKGDYFKGIKQVVWGGYWEICGFGFTGCRIDGTKSDTKITWDLLNKSWDKKVEIIGNIYENPELLEKTP